MAAFDGTSCPEEHLMAYKNLMLLYTTNPLLWCKFFPTTLTGVALTWYTSLSGGSIHNFAQLEGKFLGHFVASRRQEKSNFHLLSITQLEGESISSYLKKFHEAVLEVTDLEESVALNTLINRMKAQRLKFQMVESQTHNPKKRRSDKRDVTANHSSRSREEHSSRRERNYLPRRPEPPSDMGPPRSRHVYVAKGEPRTRNLLDGGNDPLLTRNRKDIFFAIRDQLPTPPPTTTPSDRRNYNLWCDYHKEHGHTLVQCREFKRILHQLADEGKLSRFINRKDYDARREAERRPWNQRRRSPKRDEASVHTLLKGPPKASSNGPIMRFDATTSQTLQQPHTDPLVVTLKIGQMKVKRVLVDTGSTADLITMECLRKMKFKEKHLQPLDKPLIGFGGSQVLPLGMIILSVRVRERNESRTVPIQFTVVDLTFPYNAIMGLPLINKIKAAIFPHQLLLQFERDGQVGILKGDQVTARRCLINTLKRGASITPSKREREEDSPTVMSVYLENPNMHARPHPVERYEEADMFEGKRIKIGKDLPGLVNKISWPPLLSSATSLLFPRRKCLAFLQASCALNLI
ncbi:uncharacterized protein LOC130802595 [Amaranthus tricolor]|uniref:uncharacterized protein LOC130802595 n=1 Tax=Amaranthus tricolor TaxID=29722 RepID=UPI00258E36A5|nr:uncharacterized protein LOC130802595 [Amaranthus tricolor]